MARDEVQAVVVLQILMLEVVEPLGVVRDDVVELRPRLLVGVSLGSQTEDHGHQLVMSRRCS